MACLRISGFLVLVAVCLTTMELAAEESKTTAKTDQESFTNTIGMKFISLAPGKFMMGSLLGNSVRKDETPHQVTLSKGFYMQTNEVTQEQWKKVMGSNPSKFNNCGDDCPVEQVSWNDAQEFINKLNKKESTDKYRLPTEAEWEYACRAGSTNEYYFGDDASKLVKYAWYYDNSGGKTNPVGQKQPNVWGLYDMLGNVWEWCQDQYGDYPSDSANKIALSWGYRVLRGGCWLSGHDDEARCSAREGSLPDNRAFAIGFRLCRTL